MKGDLCSGEVWAACGGKLTHEFFVLLDVTLAYHLISTFRNLIKKTYLSLKLKVFSKITFYMYSNFNLSYYIQKNLLRGNHLFIKIKNAIKPLWVL